VSKNTQQVHHLMLYQEDFVTDSIWRAVCDSLDVDPDEGSAITVYWDMKADINFPDEER
jgi:hypothetical protein